MCSYTELRALSDLRPHPNNPNKHPDNQVRALALSIERFGWRHPIVVSSRSGLIVAGHCRRMAAELLELEEVPVDVQYFKSADEELAVLLADNVIPELAELDQKMLIEHKEHFLELNWDLESIGFAEQPVRSSVAGGSGDIQIKWSVLIECATEEEQLKMIELLESEGVKCKAIMM